MQQCFQVCPLKRNDHSAVCFAVQLVSLDHITKHHVGVLLVILVDRNTVLRLTDMYPIGQLGRRFAPFLEEDNIRCDLGVGITLESSAWQTDSTDQISLLCQHCPCCLVLLVKRSCGGHKCKDTARFDFIKTFRKEVIM